MEKVRIGFIGVGGMAEYHMKTLQQIDDAVITAVCDMNADRAKEIAETFGANTYETVDRNDGRGGNRCALYMHAAFC